MRRLGACSNEGPGSGEGGVRQGKSKQPHLGTGRHAGMRVGTWSNPTLTAARAVPSTPICHPAPALLPILRGADAARRYLLVDGEAVVMAQRQQADAVKQALRQAARRKAAGGVVECSPPVAGVWGPGGLQPGQARGCVGLSGLEHLHGTRQAVQRA